MAGRGWWSAGETPTAHDPGAARCRTGRGTWPGQHVDVRLTAAGRLHTRHGRTRSPSAADGRAAIELTVQRVRRRRGVAVPRRRLRRRRPGRGPRTGRRLVRLAAGADRAGAAGRRRLGRRAADGDDPGPAGGGQQGAVPADLLGAHPRRRALRRRAAPPGPRRLGLDVAYVYTREAPEGWRGEPHRIGLADVNTHGWPPDLEPTRYVCGPTAFVETVADLLVGLGHPSRRVKTERFGPTG